MSRAERRAYERMTKNQDPYAPPVSGAAKARVDRQRARRAANQQATDPGRLLSGRAAWWVFGGAVIAFLLGLSLAWGDGGRAAMAAIIGIAAGIGWLVLSLALAWWLRRGRLAASKQGGRPTSRR